MSIISQSIGIDTVFGTNADVRLEMTATSGVQFVGVPGTSKRIWVRDIAIPVYNTITLEPDSASEYVITGSGTVAKGGALSSLTDNDYNNYGLHYVYFCNDNDCWNFTDYDRRRQLIISATPPIEEGGYLHDWGDGANARHVGWIALNSSRRLEHALCIASMFNDVPNTEFCPEGGSSWQDLTLDIENTFGHGTRYALIPANWFITVRGDHRIQNQDTDSCNFTTSLYFDSTVKKDLAVSLTRNTSISLPERWVESIHYSEKFTTTQCPLIKIVCEPTGASSTPQYNDSDGTWMSIVRTPPSQPAAFTRQFTQEYEAIARTVNGGRIEYVSDTEIQWQPYINGSIGLYNGLNWEIVTPATTPSAANTATTISGGALAVDTNYDVFATYVSSTELELEFQEWATASGRYQDITSFEGIKVYADTAEGRMKRWLGTIRMDDDSGAKFKDNNTMRFISNYYNRINKGLVAYSEDLYSSDTYDSSMSSSWEAWNNNSDDWKLEAVFLGIDTIDLQCEVTGFSDTSGEYVSISIAIDSKTSRSSNASSNSVGGDTIALRVPLVSYYSALVPMGYHYFVPLQRATGTGNQNIYFWREQSDWIIHAQFGGNIKC